MVRCLVLWSVAAVGGLVSGGCLIQLDHQLACGDGWVDRQAGEECDPGDPGSYENACEGTSRPRGIAACDEDTCQIVNDRVQCAFCGDGVLDADFVDEAQTIRLEECDGAIVPAQCPTSGPVACTAECRFDFSKCVRCGNAVVDADEECDPATEAGGIVSPRPCAGAALGTPDEVPPLRSPYFSYPYTSGNTIRCLSDCTFDRTECGYCGNGLLEGPRQTAISEQQPVQSSPAEKCDGDALDEDALADEFPQCTGEPGAVANVVCAPNCLEFVRIEGPECCLKTGEICPADGSFPRCCHEYSHPSVEQHCSNPFLPPGEEPSPDGGSRCN